MSNETNFGDTRLPLRFWDKVVPEPNSGCWLWVGALGSDGYGTIKMERTTRVHRTSFEALIGRIPHGLVLDHLCRTRCCVNPAHLDPVTHGENLYRSCLTQATINAGKTFCKQGHALDASNTRIRPTGRGCQQCHRESERARRAAKP